MTGLATVPLLRETNMSRRIVPELISPTQASTVHPAFEAAAEQAPNLRFNLKEQAELAKSLLEPGRKLYVDISQESKVNWRKVSPCSLRPTICDMNDVYIAFMSCSCSWQLGFRSRSLSKRLLLLCRLIRLQCLRSAFLVETNVPIAGMCTC